jgi:hypothetical protein
MNRLSGLGVWSTGLVLVETCSLTTVTVALGKSCVTSTGKVASAGRV